MPNPKRYTVINYKLAENDELLLRTAGAILLRNEPELNPSQVFNRLKDSERETRSDFQIELLCDIQDETDILLDYDLDRDRFDGNKSLTEQELFKRRKKSTRPLLLLLPASKLIPSSEIEAILQEFKEITDLTDVVNDVAVKLASEFHTRDTEGISSGLLRRQLDDLAQVYSDIQRKQSSLRTIEEAQAEANEIIETAAEKEAEFEHLRQQVQEQQSILATTVRQKNRIVRECQDLEERQKELEEFPILQIRSDSSDMQGIGMKTSIDPPLWVRRANQTQREATVTYIRELNCFKDLGLMADDKQLIFASLAKSGKMAIFEELSDEERSDLGKYTAYLMRVYGGTEDDIREELAKASQKPDETYPSYFRRIAGLYLRSRGGGQAKTMLPALSSITDTTKQSDIKFYFLRGLRSPAVAQHLKTQTTPIAFADLGQKAHVVADVLEKAHTIGINQVDCVPGNATATPSKDTCAMDKLMSALMDVSERICFLEKSQNERCSTCGWKSHSAKDCRASDRTKARYRSAQRRRSRSFDRGNGRRYSRERRSYGRSQDRSYDRRRESSRGRTPYRQRSRSNEKYNRRGRSWDRKRSYDRNSNGSDRRSPNRQSNSRDRRDYIDYPRSKSRGRSGERR